MLALQLLCVVQRVSYMQDYSHSHGAAAHTMLMILSLRMDGATVYLSVVGHVRRALRMQGYSHNHSSAAHAMLVLLTREW